MEKSHRQSIKKTIDTIAMKIKKEKKSLEDFFIRKQASKKKARSTPLFFYFRYFIFD